MSKRYAIGLFLESSSDYRITKEVGRKHTTITVAEAKELWETGQVGGWNVAFQRLANMNFDLSATIAYYASKKAEAAQ